MEYIQQKDFAAANKIKKRILTLYRISRKGKISPIEVKSSAYNTHSSLDKFKKKFSSSAKLGDAYILYTKDVMIKDNIIHLPVYMAMFL